MSVKCGDYVKEFEDKYNVDTGLSVKFNDMSGYEIYRNGKLVYNYISVPETVEELIENILYGVGIGIDIERNGKNKK